MRDLSRPNGLAFSPDFRVLYVNNSDSSEERRDALRRRGGRHALGGRVFADLTSRTDGLADGKKGDAQGNVYTTGPGGVWVLSPAGKHLGTIKPPETPANCAWGEDGKTLYMTAVTGIYRVKTLVRE